MDARGVRVTAVKSASAQGSTIEPSTWNGWPPMISGSTTSGVYMVALRINGVPTVLCLELRKEKAWEGDDGLARGALLLVPGCVLGATEELEAVLHRVISAVRPDPSGRRIGPFNNRGDLKPPPPTRRDAPLPHGVNPLGRSSLGL